MKVLILTSSDHLYANYALASLLRSGVFANCQLTVLEQSWIVPGKGDLSGLWTYLTKSGIIYVLLQGIKKELFVFRRLLDEKRHATHSPFYPYAKLLPRGVIPRHYHGMKSDEAYHLIRSTIRPDCILSLYSKELIPERILSIPQYGAVNLHPGYLPRDRGVSPTFWALANGEEFGGVTLHYLAQGIDTGKIIARLRIPLCGIHNEHELYMACTTLGISFIRDYFAHIQKHTPIKTIGNGGKDTAYHSLPSARAVGQFFRTGNVFFFLRDFIGDHV